MTGQLSFDWPANVSLAETDFFVSDANRAAYGALTSPWPEGKLCIVGPKGAGKSHLARVWAEAQKAQVFTEPTPDLPEARPTVIEDADRWPQEGEEWLFHLHNRLKGTAPLLLTARSDPAHWPIALPDLKSRMQGALVATITAPDEPLLTAVLFKLFADRQIAPDPELAAYLLPRIERSFEGVAATVAALDKAALSSGRKVNRKLASDWLAGRI